jgi:hypothetical protein
MNHSGCSALISAILLVLISSGLDAEGGAASPAPAPQAKDESASASTWTIGIALFTPSEGSESAAILSSTIPRLILADLQSLPTRRAPPGEAAEAAKMKSARARYAVGAELAAKLDDRALGFLDPSTGGPEKRYGMKSADKAVRDSTKKLDDAIKSETKTEKDKEPESKEVDLNVKLWEGHRTGLLVDFSGGDLPKAAKAAGVDFLVSGRVSLISPGYATVTLRGYDAILSREALSYVSHCALDDPEPLARDMAERLERYCAGRDFTRVELKSDPASAELFLNGVAVSGSSRIAYLYEPGPVHITANAQGYDSASTDILVVLGERRTVELKLEPRKTGNVALNTEPEGASLSLDSMPLGQAPIGIPLDGTRRVLSVSAEGMEPQTVVLPGSGESSLDIKLQLSDGLGPTGRINAAKDDFYWAFGWFALSVPVTTLTLGIYNGYDEAYQRSGSPSLEYSRWNASRALVAACALTATTAVFMVIRLVKYLKTAR